jgi:hypothetical protein
LAELVFSFDLPGHAARPSRRAAFVTDYGLRGGRLLIDNAPVLIADSAPALADGVTAILASTNQLVTVRTTGAFEVSLWVDGLQAVPSDRAPPRRARGASIHGGLALAASVFGLWASWLYVVRARASADPWAMKMAIHMAGWHLLLTLALFPAAIWGGAAGVRAVRATAVVFFCIHLGIAIANAAPGGDLEQGAWIAFLNAASGAAFLTTALVPPPKDGSRNVNPR